MGNTTQINLALQSYESRSRPASVERLINCYVQPLPQESSFPYIVTGTVGAKVWKDLDLVDPIYGFNQMGSDLYVVSGLTVLKIDSNKNITTLGIMADLPNRVMMTNNGTHVGILTEAGNLFLADATTLVQVTDVDYQLAESVTNLNLYFIFAKQNSFQFFLSDLNDATSYGATQVSSVENNSKPLTAMLSNNLEVWAFKEDVINVFNNDGNHIFPFSKSLGISIQTGCVSKHTIKLHKGSFYFLGSDRVIYRSVGYEVQPISTVPISEKLQTYTSVSNAFAFNYVHDGNEFYAITFPDSDQNQTFEYNITTGLWHERQSRKNGITSRWNANAHIFFAGRNLIGDKDSGIIYELDSNNFTENGETILRNIISTTLFNNFSKTSVSRFTLWMDTGVGLSINQGLDPQIMLKTSLDGGNTFGNNMMQPLGKIGEYKKEVYWTNLGNSRSIIFDISLSDPVKFNIIGAFINLEIGRS